MIKNTRSLTDSALSYLIARPGERFQGHDMAQFFGCSYETMRISLKYLREKGLIQSEKEGKTIAYWTGEKSPKAEPRQTPITHKVYALPAVMLERGREIQSDRAAFPSRHI